MPASQPDAELQTVGHYLQRVDRRLNEHRPEGGISAGGLTPQQLRYFAMKEQWTTATQSLQRLQDWRREQREQIDAPAIAAGGSRRSIKEAAWMEGGSVRQVLLDIYLADDINQYLEEYAARSGDGRGAFDRRLGELRCQVALLDAMHRADAAADHLLLVFQPLAGVSPDFLEQFVAAYVQLAGEGFDLDVRRNATPRPLQALEVGGAFAGALLAGEAGLHGFVAADEAISGVQLHILPVPPDGTYDQTSERFLSAREQWRTALSSGEAEPRNEPHPPGRVVRVYRGDGGATIDLRSRISTSGLPGVDKFREMILAGLPGPDLQSGFPPSETEPA